MTYGRFTFLTCRYNVDRKCTNMKHREECITVKHNDVLMRNIENRLTMEHIIDGE